MCIYRRFLMDAVPAKESGLPEQGERCLICGNDHETHPFIEPGRWIPALVKRQTALTRT